MNTRGRRHLRRDRLGRQVGKHPAIPVTPEQIAAAAIEAAQAGAAVAHIHVRDPQTGKAARRLELYREVVQRVRASGVDVILNLTAGMGGDYVPDENEPWRGAAGTDMASIDDRLVHVEELRPEICTLDCGSMNYAMSAYVSTPDMLRAMAARIKAAGVKPEMEVFELGHVWQAKTLVAGGADRGAAAVPALHGHPLRCRGRPARGAGDARHAAGGCRVRRVRHRADADADGGAGGADGRACPGRARGQSLARQGCLRVERRPGDSAPARSCG